MTFISRYAKERTERETIHQNILKRKEKEIISAPKDEKKPNDELKKIEKNHPKKLQLLPKGGFRNFHYKGTLSKQELIQLERFYPIYREASEKTEVNWKILAAIHYRESSLGLNQKGKGNPMQLDGIYRKEATGNLLKDLIQAGKILQKKARLAKVPPLTRNQTDGFNVRQSLFYYNGTIYKKILKHVSKPPYDRSPYVMNRIDSTHWNLPIYLGKEARHRWGVDRRLGAIPFIRELNQAFVEEGGD